MKQVSKNPELVSIRALALDYDLYPRNKTDTQHVARLGEALRSGEALPPITVQEKTLAVVDGFHRIEANRIVYGPESKIEAHVWQYKDNVEFFLHAMRLNATHGKELSTYDKAHCLVISERLQVKPELVNKVLCITPSTAKKIMENRAETRAHAPIPLRSGLQHLRRKTLTSEQAKVIPKLHGRPPIFHADQLIKMMEHDLMPEITVKLAEKLARLRELLEARGY